MPDRDSVSEQSGRGRNKTTNGRLWTADEERFYGENGRNGKIANVGVEFENIKIVYTLDAFGGTQLRHHANDGNETALDKANLEVVDF